MLTRNPVEWGAVQIVATGHALRSLGHALIHTDIDRTLVTPQVRRISYADLGSRFGVSRTHARKLLEKAEAMGLVRLTKSGRQYAELLPLYAVGALGPAEESELQAHLQSCTECQGELATLRGDAALLALSLPACVG